MRKLVVLLVLGCAFVASGGAAQAKGPNPPGLEKILGTVLPNPHAAAAVSGLGNLSYHGGPVMLTNKTYAIYWKPSGFSVSSRYISLNNQFLADVAAASGQTSNVYWSDTQYYQGSGTHISYSSTFGGSYTDTDPFPGSGCSDGVSQTGWGGSRIPPPRSASSRRRTSAAAPARSARSATSARTTAGTARDRR